MQKNIVAVHKCVLLPVAKEEVEWIDICASWFAHMNMRETQVTCADRMWQRDCAGNASQCKAAW